MAANPQTPSRREANAAALFALVDAAAGTVTNLVTSSRRLRHYDDVNTSEMPALFMSQGNETQERAQANLPAKRTQNFEIWVYTADPEERSVIPAQQMNLMFDAIEYALRPEPLTNVNTLGGLCQHAWINGSLEFYENVTADGKSIAIIKVAVLMP